MLFYYLFLLKSTIYYTEHSSIPCLQEIIYGVSTLMLLMQFSNMKNYLEIKSIISSRFEVGIINVE